MTRGESARRKGQRFQREVAGLLEADGWHVQNVGSGVSGTDLIAKSPEWWETNGRDEGITLYVETKRQERAKIPEWWRQTVANTPPGAVPLLVVKQSREPILWISGEAPR